MKSFRTYLEEKKTPKATGDLKDACWSGYTAVGMKMKNGRKVPNCVPEETQVDEALIGAQKKLDKNHNGKLDSQDFKILRGKKKMQEGDACPKCGKSPCECGQMEEAANLKQQAKIAIEMKKAGKKPQNEEVAADEMFDLIEEMVEDMSVEHGVDAETFWEKIEEIDDIELFEAAVDAKGYKSSTGGLTQKGRDAYNRKEGSHLKAPVTTPPSKLKKGSKAANRRKSFCARMSGVEGPMRKPNGEPTRKALALRKWNC